MTSEILLDETAQVKPTRKRAAKLIGIGLAVIAAVAGGTSTATAEPDVGFSSADVSSGRTIVAPRRGRVGTCRPRILPAPLQPQGATVA